MADEESEERPVKKLPTRPPRRPRTAYAYFVQENFRQVAAGCNTNNPKEVLRRIGQMWKEMPEDSKTRFREMNKKDRIRYQKEKLQWFQAYGGRPPKAKQRRREFDAPVRTRNSFIFYEKDTWTKVRDEFPGLTQREIVQQIAKRWRGLTAAEKEPYVQKSLEDRKRYAAEKKIYTKRIAETSTLERMAIQERVAIQNLERRRAQDPERAFIVERVAPPPAPPNVQGQAPAPEDVQIVVVQPLDRPEPAAPAAQAPNPENVPVQPIQAPVQVQPPPVPAPPAAQANPEDPNQPNGGG